MRKVLPSIMKHVNQTEFGGPNVLKLGESLIPKPNQNQSLIEIHSTSINRADILQRQGKYPPPKGVTNILGLEFAGYELDREGNRLRRVMGILSGGGYAQYVAVNKDHLIDVPSNITLDAAGGISEIYLTAYLQYKLSELKKGNSCLIYAAASGVGQATLQLCNHYGVIGIASCSQMKVQKIQQYTNFIVHRDQSIKDQIQMIRQYQPQGVTAVFDCVGQQNYQMTLESLGIDGKWILYGLLTGGQIEKFNLAPLLGKRIHLINSTLRSRSDQFKAELVKDFTKNILPLIEKGQISIPIQSVTKVQWNEEGINKIIRLHNEMELNSNVGKLIVSFQND
ncbi:unnamed protein product [Paramecium primaurelia]|uniref:Enoyl reductase (ER) domain-containing protein n=1 Tax=Paramecium primaurelia TaxID=5886 RepID=A0A8S1LPE8_PARPR|nr:unnamed protein product [Paramecium primaurelia]